MTRVSSILLRVAALFAFFLPLISCNTGIEATKTIKMSGADRRALQLTPDDHVMDSIFPQPLRDWRKGKRFLVTDNRAALIFDSNSEGLAAGDSLRGETIVYDGVTSRRNPDGREECQVVFLRNGKRLLYSTRKSHYDALEQISSVEVPMLIDLDLVDKTRQRLSGRRLWTLSALWYDAQGEKKQGRKFAPVTVTDVAPGDMVFPLLVSFRTDSGDSASMLMNVASGEEGSGRESRLFPSLFSLSDPKEKYPGIAPEIWDLICQGKVREGMTKEECKLAIGNPKEVASGNDWNNILDIWEYSDGTFLTFKDGLLVKFRH